MLTIIRRSSCVALSLVGALFLAALSPVVRAAETTTDLAALTQKATKSIVLVEYTWRNENVSREEHGQGLVLDKEGLILIPGSLIPEQLPSEYLKAIKIRVPADHFSPVKATLLGRTTNRLFAYLKTEKPIDAEPIDLSSTGNPVLGEQIAAVARMQKSGGYGPFVGVAHVRAVYPLIRDVYVTDSFGLTRAGSPVYDTATGKFVGIVLPTLSEYMTIQLNGESHAVGLRDEDQSAAFLAWDDVKEVLENRPKEPFKSPRPYIGVGDVAGVDEDMHTALNMDQPSGVTIGSVIPDHPADKAGLKSRDIVLAINGKPFADTVVPDLMRMYFTRAIEKLSPDHDATLTVLRDGQKVAIKIHVGTAPKEGYDFPHIFNSRLGITTRDLAFSDLYQRKLPQDTKGVMVALVKNGSAASLGSTPVRAGYLITRINDQDITDQASFEETAKALPADMKELVIRVTRPDGETQVCRIDLSR